MSLLGLEGNVYCVVLGLRLHGQTALSGCTEICGCIFNTLSIYRLYRGFVFSEYCSQMRHFAYLFTELTNFPSLWISTVIHKEAHFLYNSQQKIKNIRV